MSEVLEQKEIPEEFINQVVHSLTTQYEPGLDEFTKVNHELHALFIKISQNPFIAELDAFKLSRVVTTDELYLYECLEEDAHEHVRNIEKAADLFFEYVRKKIKQMSGKNKRQIHRRINLLFFKYINLIKKAFIIPGSKTAARNRAYHIFSARLIGKLINEFWGNEPIISILKPINFKNDNPSGDYGKFAWEALRRCEQFPLTEFEGETDPMLEVDVQELHTLTTWRRLDSPIQVHEDGFDMILDSAQLDTNQKLIQISITKEIYGKKQHCHSFYIDRVSGELRMSGNFMQANLPDSTRFRIKRIAIKHMLERLRGMEDNLVFEESKWKIKPAEPQVEMQKAITNEVRAEISKTEVLAIEPEPQPESESEQVREVISPKKTYIKLEGKRRASRVIRTLKQLLGEPLRQGRHTVFAARNGGIVACPTHGSGRSSDINVNTLKATLAMAGISHQEYVSAY